MLLRHVSRIGKHIRSADETNRVGKQHDSCAKNGIFEKKKMCHLCQVKTNIEFVYNGTIKADRYNFHIMFWSQTTEKFWIY